MLVTPRRCLWTMGLVLILLSAANAQNYAIKAGAVYTVGGEVLRPGMVLVTDGKIAAVAETVDVPAGVELLDLGDGCLMPGLVDAYSRVGVTGGADERTLSKR